MTVRILHGDALEMLRTLADESVHSVCTDPPYEIGFMGRAWDNSGIANSIELWTECLRVLKPGGHLLSFGGARTYHRMACAIEDAGFEIRDQIMWVYGSGFPKSLDVSKAIDKAAGAEREVIGQKGGRYTTPCTDIRGGNYGNGDAAAINLGAITAPATDAARQWQGWGTALKPAHEPIVVARKPLIGTVAANVLAHGTGALNIDGCRVGDTGASRKSAEEQRDDSAGIYGNGLNGGGGERNLPFGRWPANLIHDGSDEVLAGFPDAGAHGNGPNAKEYPINHRVMAGAGITQRTPTDFGDAGSAARFFYTAKASGEDRNIGSHADHERNGHPTVKPTDLMQYLVRLVTPAGGTVLDPFAGSGSTGLAADREGFDAILIEREAEYVEIAKRRILGDCPLFADITGLPLEAAA